MTNGKSDLVLKNVQEPHSASGSAWRRGWEIFQGLASILLIVGNTLFWFIILLPLAILKWAIPVAFWRRFCTQILAAIAETWASINNFNINWSKPIKWDVVGIEKLKRDGWYLVISNHRSWTDIVVLQKILNRRIPYFRFFLKKELIWVPLLGVAWWALDYPFMKRYSKDYLAKNPKKMGTDIAITRKACQRFKHKPVAIMNFVEGTRFTPEKHQRQNSPFNHLLRPKAGGVGYVLSVMGQEIHQILDITIAYPHGHESFWDFLCGRLRAVSVRVKTIPMSPELVGDYTTDASFRDSFQARLNQLWTEKDVLIGELMQPLKPSPSET